jgi:hypothetical protein
MTKIGVIVPSRAVIAWRWVTRTHDGYEDRNRSRSLSPLLTNLAAQTYVKSQPASPSRKRRVDLPKDIPDFGSSEKCAATILRNRRLRDHVLHG